VKYTEKHDVTIVVPIKGQADVRRFNKILRPSMDGIRGCKLLLITDEKIDPLPTEYLPIKVISDKQFNIPEIGGWHKQQVLKIKSWSFVDTEWILTLDADCLFLFKGHINLLMPNNKPFLSWSGKLNGSQEEWWNKASKFLGKPKPEVRCGVTPMFLKRQVCKELDQTHDVCKYIQEGATEYSLYWVWGGDLKDYHRDNLVLPSDAYWNTGGNVIQQAKRIYHSAGRIGLVQSTSDKQEQWKGKDLLGKLIEIYKNRP
jgi:hypothetical protein